MSREGSRPRGGYIAIARAIFDHPLFQSDEPYSYFEAWLWLLRTANWKPGGHRTKHAVFHAERGQLCITQRELAKAWRWPKTNVDRCLKKMLEESMIKIEVAKPGPKSGAINKDAVGYPKMRITVCNYNKYQGEPKWLKNQHVGQHPDQKQFKIPGLGAENCSEPIKTIENHKSPSVGEGRINEPRPAQGAKRIESGEVEVWWNYGTEPWIKAANDFRDFHGAAIFPEVYIGGRGNWFAEDGERIRQLRKRA
jgi:hypothetical protein